MYFLEKQLLISRGSGCGSVARVVASDSRGPWFESSHRQKIILNIYCQLYWKDENKEKRGREWLIFLKKTLNIKWVLVLIFTCAMVHFNKVPT